MCPRNALGAFFLLLLCIILIFHELGTRDLWSSHEGRAAQNARTILHCGQWGLPRLLDGRVELQKPPLYYWLVAAVGGCRGEVDAWAVRLPAALAAVAVVMLVYWFGAHLGRPLLGLAGAGCLATCVHFTLLARTGRIDMPLALMVALALVSFFLGGRASRGYRSLWFLPAYLALTLTVLLKGPIGVVLVGVGLVSYLIVERAGAKAVIGSACWGVPLFLLLVSPWFLWAIQETDGEILDKFFWYHNVVRAFGGEGLRAHPWWFYLVRVPVDLLPWSLLVPAAIWSSIRSGWWREDAVARFGLVWFVGMFLALSCARFKRADYLLPAYPGLALFLGCWLERVLAVDARRRGALFAASLLAPALGWCVYVTYYLPEVEPMRERQSFAEEIRRLAPAPQPVLFFRVEAHALAFHVGRPMDTILEWENLDIWASRPEPIHVVMTPEDAGRWRQHLKTGWLEPVLQQFPHDRPLVLMRSGRISH